MVSLSGSEKFVQEATTWLLSWAWRVPVQGERDDERGTDVQPDRVVPAPDMAQAGASTRLSEKGLDVSCSDCTPGSQTQAAAQGDHREQGSEPAMAGLPEDRAHGSFLQAPLRTAHVSGNSQPSLSSWEVDGRWAGDRGTHRLVQGWVSRGTFRLMYLKHWGTQPPRNTNKYRQKQSNEACSP